MAMNLLTSLKQQLRMNESLSLGAHDAAVSHNALSPQSAEARPLAPERERSDARDAGLCQQWDGLALALESALSEVRPDTAWMTELMALHQRVEALAEQRPDASLYHLIYTAGHVLEHYSANHGLLCLLIARETARALGWNTAQTRSLELAALTMNVAMSRLQDALAISDPHINAAMRAEIKDHAERGAEMLDAGGVVDPLWIGVVRGHHDELFKLATLAELSAVHGAVRLLRRVDVFAAKISRRATRAPMSPVNAAREACLGPNGTPDEIGTALFKSVGLYPPGSFVQLGSGEVGIVLARGRQANTPVVVALVAANGSPLAVPALRDTQDKRCAVRFAVSSDDVKVRPAHDQLLALR